MKWRLRKAYPISMYLFITAIVYALVMFVVSPLDNNTGLAIAGFMLIISGEMAYFLKRYNVTVSSDKLRVNQRVYHVGN